MRRTVIIHQPSINWSLLFHVCCSVQVF